jgi:salicylate hydroxylase
MAIESGVTLATVLKSWNSNDLESALGFYQGIRKPRTDKVTKTSYEAGKLASADNQDVMTATFDSEALRERMKWIMDYDILADVQARGSGHFVDNTDKVREGK